MWWTGISAGNESVTRAALHASSYPFHRRLPGLEEGVPQRFSRAALEQKSVGPSG